MSDVQKISWRAQAMTFVWRAGFIIAVTVLAWFNVAAAVIAICATILVTLHGKAASIIEFSFGPLKAKIERDLSEAEKLLDRLKRVAAVQARQAIAASAWTGRFASENDWIFLATKRTEAALKEIGVSEDDLREARRDLIDLTVSDFGRSATGGNRIPSELGEEAIAEWTAARRGGLFSNPDEVESWLRKWGSLTPARQLRIDDMRWVIEHQDIRDSEQYMRAHRPVEWDDHD